MNRLLRFLKSLFVQSRTLPCAWCGHDTDRDILVRRHDEHFCCYACLNIWEIRNGVRG